MKTDYITELGKSYMILNCKEKEDSFAVQMLEENHIRSLLPFERRYFNGELQFFYDVTGMSALADRIEKKPLGAKDIRRILQELYCVFEEIHSYFLEPEGLLLRAEYIYETSEKILFCYCPSNDTGGLEATIETFAEKLLDQIDNEEEEALQLSYRFYAQVKDAKKGILYILEEVLTEADPFSMPEDEQMQVQIPVNDLSVVPEKEKIAARKPDVYIIGCFLLSFLVGVCCCFLLPVSFMSDPGMRTVFGILMAGSVAGIIVGLTDIDIVRKK